MQRAHLVAERTNRFMIIARKIRIVGACGAVALSALAGWTARGQERGKPGLASYYQLFRRPNGYEGGYSCQNVCLTREQDAGRYPDFVRAEGSDPNECIARIIEKAKKDCPRIGW